MKIMCLVDSQGCFHIRAEDIEQARRTFLRDVEQQEKTVKEDSRDYSNPVLYRVEACKGKAFGCPFGLVDTQRLAERVVALLDELQITEFLLQRTEGLLLPHHKIKIAIAGCPNSCIQPQIKDFGIIAQMVPSRSEADCTHCGLCIEGCREGAITLEQEGPSIDRYRSIHCGLCIQACPQGALVQGKAGYRLLIGGRLGRHPRLGRETLTLASEEEVIRKIVSLLENFKSSAKPQERFSHFIECLHHEDKES
jgi:dissimilatory sulfite reductase (desulfoviridin) alpha/beta subunit